MSNPFDILIVASTTISNLSSIELQFIYYFVSGVPTSKEGMGFYQIHDNLDIM